MDGFLILDLDGYLLLHSNLHPHSFVLHQFIHSISKYSFKQQHSIPPCIYFNPKTSSSSPSSPSSPSSSSSSTSTTQEITDQFASISCNLIHHQLWFAVIASADFEPSIAFEYLNRFKNLLLNTYLNKSKIDRNLIQTHFDLIHQLIHLTAPNRRSNPFGKNCNQLELIHQFIPNKLDRSIVNLISDSTQYSFKNDKHSHNKPSIFSSPIPWRAVGHEHQKQEIWIDLVESISVILDQSGQILKFEVVGFVDFQSKLNGLPDLLLKFNDPSKITTVGFHNCVRQGVWTNQGNVSFIPPDGSFRLMSYRKNMLENISKIYRGNSTGSSSTSLPNTIPIRIEPKVTVGEKGGSFQFIIKANSNVTLNKFIIRWKLGKFATGILLDHLSCISPDGRQNILISSDWDQLLNQISWTFNTDSSVDCCLSGLWSHKSQENQPDHSLAIEFESKTHSPNISYIGFKIEKIDLISNRFNQTHSFSKNNNGRSCSDTIHKGVKVKLISGVYEVRWD